MTTNYSKLVFTADDRTREAFSSVQRNLGEINGAAARLSSLLPALGVGLSAAGFASFIKGTIDVADSLNDLSKSTGVSVESLAGLKYAAVQSGVELDTVARGVQKFAGVVLDAGNGSKQAQDQIARLGLSLEQLRGQTPEQQFYALAGALKGIAADQRPAVLIDTLGQKLGNLAPLLDEGSDGLRAMVEEGKRLSPITTEMAEQADRFNDELGRMKAAAEGAGAAIAGDLLPSVTSLFNQLRAAQSSGSWLGFFTTSGAEAKNASAEIKKLGDTIAELKRQRDALDPDKSFANKLNDVVFGDIATLDAQIKVAESRVAYLKKLAEIQTAPDAPKIAERRIEPTIDVEKARASAKKAADAMQKVFNENRRQEAQNRQVEFDIDWAKITGDADAEKRLRDLRETYVALIDPVEKYRKQLAEVDELEQAGKLSADQANEARLKINDAIDGVVGFGDALKDVNRDAERFGLQVNSSFERFLKTGGKVSDLLKTIAADFASLVYQKTVGQELEKYSAKAADWLLNSIDFGPLFPSAKGNVFMSSPGLSAYSGSVVSKPTLFPFASGIGLMGEAGPEAILPLKRGSDGKLGVSGGGPVINIYHNETIDARGAQRGVDEDIRRALKDTEDRAVDRSVNKVMDLNQRGALRFS